MPPHSKSNARTGRPSDYTPEIADRICNAIMEGTSVRSMCAAEDMPAESTVYAWLSRDNTFAEKYARAREVQMERMAEQILEISDDGRNDTYTDEEGNERVDHDVIARSKLRVDTRKWLMSKLAPKKYGNKVALTGPDGGDIGIRVAEMTPQQRKRRILELGKKEAEQNGDVATAKALGETLARMDEQEG